MDFEVRRTQMLKILPKDLRLELFKKLSESTSISQIKEWIRVQIEYEVGWERDDAAARGRKGLHALEPSCEEAAAPEGPSEEDMEALMNIGPSSTLAEILAVQNRMKGYNPKQRVSGQPVRRARANFAPRLADPAAASAEKR